MAGDWIKMRTSLASDPAVISIADRLDISEFEVVGMLHHLWTWADAQSRDGHADGVTAKWVNRYVHRDGFSEAMAAAGWLVISDNGIEFPKFSRHNGEPAKARALSSNRKQKQRAKVTNSEGQTSRYNRDESVTREEKRREEVNTPPAPPFDEEHKPPEPKPKRKTRIPAPFLVTPLMRQWAAERAPGVNLDTETEKFVNYWRGSGGTKLDWIATWRTWLLKAQEDVNRRPPARITGPNFDDLSWADNLGGL